MKQGTPRVRMFAGPNGSGKSVLKSYLPKELLGIYLNADEIEAQARKSKTLDFKCYEIAATTKELKEFFLASELLRECSHCCFPAMLGFDEMVVDFSKVEMNAYYASVAVAFVRQKLLDQQRTFTFETVMSHPAKVEFLDKAQKLGYRTYLYYIATEHPDINISRVQHRVRLGGHDVPTKKIVERYERSLSHLLEAIKLTNRAYIFDNSITNSSGQVPWIAEITDGTRLELKTTKVPDWFVKSVLNKLPNSQ